MLQTENQYALFLEHIKKNGMLTTNECDHITRLAHSTHESWDQVICKLGFITEAALHEHLVNFSGLQQMDGKQQDISAVDNPILNKGFLQTRRLLPYKNGSETTYVAVVDPFDEDALTAIQFALEIEFQPVLVGHSEWEKRYSALYPDDTGGAENEDENDITSDAAKLADLASSEPVIRLVNRFINTASEQNASDVHIESSARETVIRFRIDGVLYKCDAISQTQGLSVLSRIKILSNLDIAERRRPQDGRFTFSVAGRAIDIRVSTIPTDHGESAVLRLLDQAAVQLDHQAMGFSEDTISTVERILGKLHGILLVTGPTGSGKTTTLYSFLKQLAKGDRKILTIEDPIEYRLAGVSQSQVNPKVGVTFASALRSFLRHDPDVMMVGEIRDLETARIAIQAALTGHLVLSTLHTNDAPSAITRLRDLGIEDFLISSTLIGVIGQRLVRRLCLACSGDSDCSECNGTGYRGRLAITETVEVIPAVAEAIRNGKAESTIVSANAAFSSIVEDGAAKVSSGLTDKEELTRVLGAAYA